MWQKPETSGHMSSEVESSVYIQLLSSLTLFICLPSQPGMVPPTVDESPPTPHECNQDSTHLGMPRGPSFRILDPVKLTTLTIRPDKLMSLLN